MLSERDSIRQRRRKLFDELRGLTHAPLMRGSVVERLRKCGKANCACARDPDARHGGKVLVVQLDGRTESQPLRAEDEAGVRAAIAAYERAWAIINGLTACELAELRRAVRERKRARQRRS